MPDDAVQEGPRHGIKAGTPKRAVGTVTHNMGQCAPTRGGGGGGVLFEIDQVWDWHKRTRATHNITRREHGRECRRSCVFFNIRHRGNIEEKPHEQSTMNEKKRERGSLKCTKNSCSALAL